MAYDAFISYNRAADGELAVALQRGLERLSKPWYRRRPFLRVVRDETTFAASADIDDRVERSLADSGHLVLLLSTGSAASPWVDKEIAYWVANRGRETITPVVTEWYGNDPSNPSPTADLGEFRWDGEHLPPSLRGVFDEPLAVDLRWTRAVDPAELNLDNERFADAVAVIAAGIRGQDKDELIGALVAMKARARILTGAILAAIAILLVTIGVIALSWLGIRDNLERERATLRDTEQQVKAAQADLLAAGSELEAKQAEIEAKQAEVDELSDEVLGKELELARKQNELVAKQAEVDEKQREVVRLEGDVTRLNSDIEGLNGDITKLSSDITKLNGDITKLNGDITKLNGDITKLNGEIDKKQLELEALQREAILIAAANEAVQLMESDLAAGALLAAEAALGTVEPTRVPLIEAVATTDLDPDTTPAAIQLALFRAATDAPSQTRRIRTSHGQTRAAAQVVGSDLIVMSGQDGAITLWDPVDGEISTPLARYPDALDGDIVYAVAGWCGPDRCRLAASGESTGRYTVFSFARPASGASSVTITRDAMITTDAAPGCLNRPATMDFSRDGDILAIGDRVRSLHLYSTEAIRDGSFGPRTTLEWPLVQGDPGGPNVDHCGLYLGTYDVAFAPAGCPRLLAVGSEDGRVVVWNLDTTATHSGELVDHGRQAYVEFVATQDRCLLFTSGATQVGETTEFDNALVVWDAGVGADGIIELDPLAVRFADGSVQVTPTPGGDVLLLVTGRTTTQRFEIRPNPDGVQLRPTQGPNEHGAGSIGTAFVLSGDRIVVRPVASDLVVSASASTEPLRHLVAAGVRSIARNGAGDEVAVVTSEALTRYSVNRGGLTPRESIPIDDDPRSVAYSRPHGPCPGHLVVGGAVGGTGWIRTLDPATGRLGTSRSAPLPVGKIAVSDVADEGCGLVAALLDPGVNRERKVAIWRLTAAGELEPLLPDGGWLSRAAGYCNHRDSDAGTADVVFVPGSDRLIASYADQLLVFDAAPGAARVADKECPDDPFAPILGRAASIDLDNAFGGVTGIDVSADGTQVVASFFARVAVWDIAQIARQTEPTTRPEHVLAHPFASDVGFSRDGRFVAAASPTGDTDAGGTTAIWTVGGSPLPNEVGGSRRALGDDVLWAGATSRDTVLLTVEADGTEMDGTLYAWNMSLSGWYAIACERSAGATLDRATYGLDPATPSAC